MKTVANIKTGAVFGGQVTYPYARCCYDMIQLWLVQLTGWDWKVNIRFCTTLLLGLGEK